MLDLSQLDTLPSNLDLSVDPAENLQLPIRRAIANVVPCPVGPDLLAGDCYRNKTTNVSLRICISACQAIACNHKPFSKRPGAGTAARSIIALIDDRGHCDALGQKTEALSSSRNSTDPAHKFTRMVPSTSSASRHTSFASKNADSYQSPAQRRHGHPTEVKESAPLARARRSRLPACALRTRCE